MACLLPNLVEICITNSGLLTNPSWVPLLHKGELFDPITIDLSFWLDGNAKPADVVDIRDQFQSYGWQNEPFFFKNANGDWEVNKDSIRNAKKNGLPLERANKLVHCQTLDDPVFG